MTLRGSNLQINMQDRLKDCENDRDKKVETHHYASLQK